jgi:hypothetical protein
MKSYVISERQKITKNIVRGKNINQSTAEAIPF